MATIPTLDYLVDYYDLEPSLFRESDNLHKLFQSIFYVCHTQQIDLLWFAENILNIDAAENAHLDFIGSIVGQPRFLTDFNTEPYFGYEGSYQSKTFGSSLDPEVGGYWNSRSYFNTASSRQLNDDEYRRLIKARAIYNQSNCTANDLLEVINLLSNSKNNTVQMLNHGLIQITTDDSSGIISYFVDRLLNDDNILPIAAGVRVGLEQSASDGSGGGILDTDWTVKKVYEGSTGSKVGIDAVRTKNNLEVKSSIEVTPTVGQISDRIKSGEFGAEVNKAVLDIDSEATEWVLDPPNNRVKYTVYVGAGGSLGHRYILTYFGVTVSGETVRSACDNWIIAIKSSQPKAYVHEYLDGYCRIRNNSGGIGSAVPTINKDYVPPEPVEKYIPIDTVSAKVIANAESGHAESKNLLVSVVSVLASMKLYDPLF